MPFTPITWYSDISVDDSKDRLWFIQLLAIKEIININYIKIIKKLKKYINIINIKNYIKTQRRWSEPRNLSSVSYSSFSTHSLCFSLHDSVNFLGYIKIVAHLSQFPICRLLFIL